MQDILLTFDGVHYVGIQHLFVLPGSRERWHGQHFGFEKVLHDHADDAGSAALALSDDLVELLATNDDWWEFVAQLHLFDLWSEEYENLQSAEMIRECRGFCVRVSSRISCVRWELDMQRRERNHSWEVSHISCRDRYRQNVCNQSANVWLKKMTFQRICCHGIIDKNSW